MCMDRIRKGELNGGNSRGKSWVLTKAGQKPYTKKSSHKHPQKNPKRNVGLQDQTRQNQKRLRYSAGGGGCSN